LCVVAVGVDDGAQYQVDIAIQALFWSETEALTATLQRIPADVKSYEVIKKPPWVDQVFLPVIVTSARVFICDFKPEDIDPVTGEIPYSKAQINEEEYII
jgi:hypothetical protein